MAPFSSTADLEVDSLQLTILLPGLIHLQDLQIALLEDGTIISISYPVPKPNEASIGILCEELPVLHPMRTAISRSIHDRTESNGIKLIHLPFSVDSNLLQVPKTIVQQDGFHFLSLILKKRQDSPFISLQDVPVKK
jgi:hypothetical protein